MLGRDVAALALPLNSHSRRVFQTASRCGYRTVFTSDPGFCRPGDDPLRLKRIIVDGKMSLREFLRLLDGRGLAMRRVLARIKSLPPLILGYQRWMPIRRHLFASPAGRFLTPAALRRGTLAGLVVAAAVVLGGVALALLRHLRAQ
jgi:hypothetical protein